MPDTREKCPECDGRGVDPWNSTCLLCGGQGRVPFREWGKENDEDEVSDTSHVANTPADRKAEQ